MAISAHVVGCESPAGGSAHDMQEIPAKICGRDRETSRHRVSLCGLGRIIEPINLGISRGRRLRRRVLDMGKIEIRGSHPWILLVINQHDVGQIGVNQHPIGQIAINKDLTTAHRNQRQHIRQVRIQ